MNKFILFQEYKGSSTVEKYINVIYHINKLEHLIFNYHQLLSAIHVKSISKFRIEETFLSLINYIYLKSIANILFCGKILKASSLKFGTGKNSCHYHFKQYTGSPRQCNKSRKKMRKDQKGIISIISR